MVVAIVLIIVLGAMAPVQAGSITVDINQELGTVNRSVLGNNMVGYPESWKHSGEHWYTTFHIDGAGVWDPVNYRSVPEMVNFVRDISISFSRFPGGCGVHWYNWKDGVGPIEERPAIYGPNGDERFEFGLPEFLQNSEDIGAVPVITVSDYTGTVQDAADLAEYLNAPNDGSNPNGGIDWAQVRAADGHPEPRGVVWFEYGNETWHGDHGVTGVTFTPEEYVNNYMAYRAAMQAVDPNIKLGAVIQKVDWDWTEKVIQGTGKAADFFITHKYAL